MNTLDEDQPHISVPLVHSKWRKPVSSGVEAFLRDLLPLGGISLLRGAANVCGTQQATAIATGLIGAVLEAGRPVFYVDCRTGGGAADIDRLRTAHDTPLLVVMQHPDRWIELVSAGAVEEGDDRFWLAESTQTVIRDALADHESEHGPALVVFDWVEGYRPVAGEIAARSVGRPLRSWSARSSNAETQRSLASDLAAFAGARGRASTVAVSRHPSRVCRDAIRDQAALVATVGTDEYGRVGVKCRRGDRSGNWLEVTATSPLVDG